MEIPHPITPGLAELIAERFQLLAEPMRICILDRLREGPMSVGALTQELGTSQQNVSKHLGLLLRAGVLTRTKHGTAALYEIADASVFGLCEQVCGGIQRRLEAQWSLVGHEATAQ